MLGFFPIQKATAIVLAVIMGVAVFGVFEALNDSYQGQVTDVNRVLGDLGPTTIELEGDRKEARNQMEAAIVWNAMAASDCRVLMGAHTISNMKVGEQSIAEGSSLETGDKPLEYHTLEGWMSKKVGKPKVIDGGPENAYIGSFESFMPLIDNGFTKKCIGQKSVIKEMRDASKSAAASIIGDIGNLGGKIVAVGSAGAFLVGCAATAGTLCVGGAIAAGVIIDGVYSTASNLAEDLAKKTLISGDIGSEPGFDMEGRYGKLNFVANQSFTIGESGHDTPLFGISLNINKHKQTPGFWQGRRLMYAVPDGLEPDDRDDKDHVLSRTGRGNMLPDGDFSDRSVREKFYAWRVRMINVPIIATHEITQANLNDGCGNKCNHNARYLQNFLDETSFLFCEGARGYLQSNAKRIGATGEVTGENSAKEDQVYPFVEIEENAESCLSGEQRNRVSVPGRSSEIPILSGNIIDDLAAIEPEIDSSSDVVEITDSKIEFNGYGLEDSTRIPLFIWQELPEGEKEVEISFDVKKEGQLVFSLYTEATTPPTAVNNPTSSLELTKQDIPVQDNYKLEIIGTGDEIEWRISHPDDGVRRSKVSEGEFERLIMSADSDLEATINSMVVEAEGSNSGSQTGDLSGYDIDLGNYRCRETSDMGTEKTIFSVEKEGGGTYESWLNCGGIENTVDLPTYDGGDAKELEYWMPQSYLRGCSTGDFNIVDKGISRDIGSNDKKSGWSLGSAGNMLNINEKPSFNYDSSSSANKTVMITLTTENGRTPKLIIASNNTENGKEYYTKFIDESYSVNESFTMSGISNTQVDFTDKIREQNQNGPIAGSSEYTEIAINGRTVFEPGIGEVTDMEIETLTLRDYREDSFAGQSAPIDPTIEDIIQSDSKISNSQTNLNLNEVIVNAEPAVCNVVS